jgi:hypothetical protein
LAIIIVEKSLVGCAEAPRTLSRRLAVRRLHCSRFFHGAAEEVCDRKTEERKRFCGTSSNLTTAPNSIGTKKCTKLA